MAQKNRSMNSQGRNQQPDQNQPQQPPLTPELLQAYFQKEQLEAQNEAKRIQLRERELEMNARFASESLAANKDLIDKKPRQDRLTFITYSIAALVFVVVVMLFMAYLIEAKQHDIVASILKGIAWVGTTVGSFYLGKGQGRRERSDSTDTQDAEVVE